VRLSLPAQTQAAGLKFLENELINRVSPQPPSFTFGTSTARTDWNDHHLRSSSPIFLLFPSGGGDRILRVRGILSLSSGGEGWGAEARAYGIRSAHFYPLDQGINLLCGQSFLGRHLQSSSVCRTAFMSRLFSGSPGTMAGPVSPPLSNPSRESSTKLPLILSASWL